VGNHLEEDTLQLLDIAPAEEMDIEEVDTVAVVEELEVAEVVEGEEDTMAEDDSEEVVADTESG